MKDFIKVFFSISILFILLMQVDFLRISGIYFFDGIYILIIICLLPFLIYRKKIKNLLIIVISVFSINFGFFVLFPVSFERSVSVGLLNSMSEYSEDKTFTKQEITEEIINLTSTEQFTNKRIEEQLYTGYFEKTGERYVLSKGINTYLLLNRLMGFLYNFDYDS